MRLFQYELESRFRVIHLHFILIQDPEWVVYISFWIQIQSGSFNISFWFMIQIDSFTIHFDLKIQIRGGSFCLFTVHFILIKGPDSESFIYISFWFRNQIQGGSFTFHFDSRSRFGVIRLHYILIQDPDPEWFIHNSFWFRIQILGWFF